MENQIEQIQETALTWPEKATALAIVDQGTYDSAAGTLIDIAEIEKKIKEHHEPMKKAAHEAHRAAVAGEKKFLDPLNEAKKIIKRSISNWETEQRRIREEKEQKLREEAQKKEEEERLALAEEAEKAGKPAEEVEKILETPTKKVEPIVVKPTFVQNARVGTRETWKAEVTDIKALCRAASDGKAPIESVMANMPVLNAAARASKENLVIPGVKAVKETNVITR